MKGFQNPNHISTARAGLPRCLPTTRDGLHATGKENHKTDTFCRRADSTTFINNPSLNEAWSFEFPYSGRIRTL